MKKLYGVISAMTTPFDQNGAVDIPALKQEAEHLIGNGVHCLYPCGTTGEMYLCSVDERKLIAETVVRKADSRVPVFIHVGANKQDETITLAKHAYTIGADGIAVVTPSYFNISKRAMLQYYCDVCSAVPEDFPVYVYVIPQLAHNDISADTMEEICNLCPNVVGVKYSYPDMTRLLEYLRVKNGNFSVVFGADHLFLPALIAGVDGVVSGCSVPFPEPFVAVYEKYQSGDLKGAKAAQEKACTLAWLMQGGADMSIFKNILTYRGIRGGHVRKPLLDLTDEENKMLYDAVQSYL